MGGRRLAVAVATAFVCCAAPAIAQQADFPNRPVRVMVGFAAGGPSDIIARVVGTKTIELLGQSVIVENKTGAGGMIAAEAVARSAPDGYTLSNTATSIAVNETLSKTIRVEFGKDLIAVAPQAESSNILVVHPSLGVKTMAELIAMAKAKPGELLYASAGRGSATHLAAEMFNMMSGTKMMPVHYRGGAETIKDLITGQVKIMFSTMPPVQELVRQGKLIALAVTGPKRERAFPNIPTVAEAGVPGYDVRFWVGLTAPRGTPQDIIRKIGEANNKALALPEVQTALAAQGFSPWIGSAQEFDAFYRAEREKYAKVIKASGMDKQ